MNVSCTSCSAKYALPDEKVRGKKVKITCKHCGTGIIVDGTKIDAAGEASGAAPAPAAAAPAAAAPAAATPAAAVAPAPVAAAPKPAAAAPAVAAAPKAAPAAELSFDIAYPDDRQETLTVSQIVDKYAAGTLDDLAFLWREGMGDWKAPFDIPEIASALSARGLKKAAAAPAAAAFGDGEDEATKVQDSPFEGMMDDKGDSPGVWTEPGKEAPSNPEAAFDLRAPAALPFEQAEPAASPKPAAAAAASPKPAAVAPAAKQEAPKPAAARRSAARGGGDLFGDLAAAGSEEDESLGSDAKEAAPKMTGARNESSVLFSLDALVKQEQKPAAKKAPAAKKQDDDAAILMGTDSSPNSIANVGTGAFGSAFAAPDFNAPVAAPPPEVRAADPVALTTALPAKKKGMGLWIGIGAVLLIGGGAVAAGLPAKLAGTPAPAPTPSAAAETKPTETPATGAAVPTPAPDASTAPAASAAPAAAGGAAATAAPAAAGGTAAVAAATPATPKPGDTTAKPAEKPTEKPAEKPAEAPASDAPPFDKAAAIAALSAAAGNAQSCKGADGPAGSGKVSITFMPSGRATNTQVSGDLAGTAAGGCVARLFRSAKVPAFSGEAVTVSKSFQIN